jgi:hypothetical protein
MSIKYPPRHSEFEIHAYLYHRLHSIGYDVRGEVTLYLPTHKCRFDLVIFHNKEAVCIIEVKDGVFMSNKQEEHHYQQWKKTRQGRRYRELGLKVFYCRGMERTDFILREIVSFMDNLVSF